MTTTGKERGDGRYNLSDADDRLAALVERAEAGEDVEIVRDGRVVAHLTASSAAALAPDLTVLRDRRRKLVLERIRIATAGMALDPIDSVVEMRKQARY